MGHSRSALTYPAGNSPISVAVGDFNKDGKPDLAIAGDCGLSTCAQPGEVNVLLGNGDGSFQAAATYAVGYSPTSIVAGDVNGDGNLDLAVANACGKDSSCQSNGTATLLIGDGKGAFTLGKDVQLGNSPSALTLGDLNGDGALDLVAGYRADNKVGLLLSNGDGTFKPQVTYQVGTAPSAVVVADFNGDGKRDVAVANFKDSKVSVLFGNGDGTLQTAVHYPVGVGPESLVAIDPDNSGHADLVSANGNGGLSPKGSDVTVLRNLALASGNSNTQTTVTSAPDPSSYLEPVTIKATVVNVPPPICNPDGGTVDFTDTFEGNQTNLCLGVMVSKGEADCQTSTLLAGGMNNLHTLTATYKGNGTCTGSSGSDMQEVDKAATTTTITSIVPAPGQDSYLQTVTFTVSVTGANGGTPTGTLDIQDVVSGSPVTVCTVTLGMKNGASKRSKPDDGSGGSCMSNSLTVGDHQIQATYNGDGNFNTSTSAPPIDYPVSKAATTTTITGIVPAPGQDSYLQTVTFTVSVTGANGGTPTGTVDIQDVVSGSPVTVCTVTLGMKNGASKRSKPDDGSGGSCMSNSLTVGDHQIQATYNGDGNFNTSTSAPPIDYPVSKAATTTTITGIVPAPGQDSYLQTVTFTVSVTGANGGTPTGTVDIQDVVSGSPVTVCTVTLGMKNGASKRSSKPNDGNGGSCESNSLAIGDHQIQATYNGDGNFNTSTSAPPIDYPVSKAATTTTITGIMPAPGQDSYLQTVTFTVSVTGANGGTPTGTVDIQDVVSGSPVTVCTVTLGMKNGASKRSSKPNDGNGGSCESNSLAIGDHQIQATYNGDGNFNTSTSAPPIDYPVSKAATTTTITGIVPAPGQDSYLQTVTFTVSVTGANGGTPTGTVDIQDVVSGSPVTVCTVTLGMKNGASKRSSKPNDGNGGSCESNSLAIGDHQIQATYNGDGNFNTSTSAPPIDYPVSKAATTTTITGIMPAPGQDSYLQTVTFTVSVTGANGGTPTGTVDIQDVVSGSPVTVCTVTLGMKNGASKRSSKPNDGNGGSCESNSLAIGDHQIQATYNGDGNFNTSTSAPPIDYPVSKAATTTTITGIVPAPGQDSYLQTVTFTVSVTGANGGTPTGTVDIQDVVSGSPVTVCTVTLGMKNGASKRSSKPNDGNGGSCESNSLAIGDHQIQATYNGDGNFNTSTSAPPIDYPVSKAATTTTITSIVPAPGQDSYLQTVTFTVSVTGANGGTPTGTVDIQDVVSGSPVTVCTVTLGMKNGASKRSKPDDGSGGSCMSNSLTVGDHQIQATYNGDGNFNTSTSAPPIDYPVSKAGTKTVISDVEPPSPSTYGTQVTFTAMVTGDNGGNPTGTVTIWDVTDPKNQVMICTGPLNANGGKGKQLPQGNGSTATCKTDPNNPLMGGAHMIDAVYNPNGDPDFNTSTSDPIKYVVNKAKPKFEPLLSSKNPSNYGDPVTFTATLDGVAGGQQPTGNVVFTDTYNNNTPTVICTSPLKQGANNSVATCSTPPPQLLGGSHCIVATYSDDKNYGPADPSQQLCQTVNKAKPKFEPLQSSKNPSTYGDTVTFTATLDGVSGYPQPTGNVVFTDTYKNTPTVICTSALKPGANNSTATCTTPPPLLLGGSHSIVATYTDDANYTSADPSAPLVQVVQKEKPKFEALQSSKNPSTYGDTLTFTATLDGVSGDPQPTGTVVFTDTYNNTPTVICTSPLSPGANNSSATCTNPSAAIPYLLGGSHSIVATYIDDNNYTGADPSAPLVQTVQRARPTTSVTSSPNPSVQGQSVGFTVPVTGVSGGLAPTGNVTFTYANNGGNSTPISECSNPIPLANNQAVCITKTLASGMDNVTAAYSGDNNYTDSEPSLTQTVEDFAMPSVNPPSIIVTQGFNNTNDPFNAQPTITAAAAPLYGFSGTLGLSCAVVPAAGQNGQNLPTCAVNPGMLSNGGGSTSVAIAAGSSTPIGLYTVTITAADTSDNSGLFHTTSLTVNVVNQASAISVIPGSSGTTPVTFSGPPGVTVTNLVCSLIVGTGLPSSGEIPPKIGITCPTFSPSSVVLSSQGLGPVTVTVQTSATTTAFLRSTTRILAALWLGMPAIVLIGSPRTRKLSRKTILQFLGMLLILVTLLEGVGCGGGFTPPPAGTGTPTGLYNMLIQGTDSNNVVYSAVVPVNVGH